MLSEQSWGVCHPPLRKGVLVGQGLYAPEASWGPWARRRRKSFYLWGSAKSQQRQPAEPGAGESWLSDTGAGTAVPPPQGCRSLISVPRGSVLRWPGTPAGRGLRGGERGLTSPAGAGEAQGLLEAPQGSTPGGGSRDPSALCRPSLRPLAWHAFLYSAADLKPYPGEAR